MYIVLVYSILYFQRSLIHLRIGSKWHSRRKILTPAFHFNVLQQFLGVFAEESELLAQQLEGECGKAHTDIVPFITQFTLHSICGKLELSALNISIAPALIETAMGVRLQRNDKTSQEYTKAIFRIGQVMLCRITHIWYFNELIFAMSSLCREQKKLLKILHGFSASVINNRKISFEEPEVSKTRSVEKFSPKKRLAMLDLLISAKNSGQAIDDKGIQEEVDTFMFEGHDTTAASICFTLLSLACHSKIQNKVVLELQEVFGNSERAPTFEDLQKLEYLDLVLKESLRMYPSVPFVARVTDEDVYTPSGYTIPVGTLVEVHIYDMHHNPQLYPEPEKFDPDRFLPENCQKRHPFAYLPFSGGPRNCIGQRFAVLEIKTVISTILRRFILEPVDTPDSITFIAHLILKTKDGIKIKLQKRVNPLHTKPIK